jgi:hypothetical protein
MTANHRSLVRSATLITALTGLFVLMTSWLYDIAYAASAPSQALPDSGDAQGWVTALYEFVTKGAHVPAVGAFLVIAVWVLRMFAVKIPWLGIGAWFATKIGGYALGLGTAVLLDFGLALAAGGVFTWGLIGVAIGHGYAASGGWEHLKDVFGYLGKKPVVGASAAASFAIVCIAASCSGCPTGTSTSQAVSDVVDCMKQNQASIEQTAEGFGCHYVGGVITQCSSIPSSWPAVEAQAETAGLAIGGCVLADLVQWYLTRPMAKPVGDTQAARNALETFRVNVAHNATFRTPLGDL